jgi:hypothetical protein
MSDSERDIPYFLSDNHKTFLWRYKLNKDSSHEHYSSVRLYDVCDGDLIILYEMLTKLLEQRGVKYE